MSDSVYLATNDTCMIALRPTDPVRSPIPNVVMSTLRGANKRTNAIMHVFFGSPATRILAAGYISRKIPPPTMGKYLISRSDSSLERRTALVGVLACSL
jgi:hypothetical protein